MQPHCRTGKLQYITFLGFWVWIQINYILYLQTQNEKKITECAKINNIISKKDLRKSNIGRNDIV